MSTKADQVITLSQVQSLSDGLESKKSIIWKEFGNFLDKSVEIQEPIASNNSILNKFIANSFPDRSYLSQSIAYKICNSCQRPIGLKSLEQHYTKCVEMKQKRQQEQQDNASSSNNNQLKKKRGRNGALIELEGSSVDSSRSGTPVPNNSNTPTNSNSNTNNANSDSAQPVVKPKKKYKKSQAQKEKEAAAAAAAAAAASNGEKPPKKKKAAAAATTSTPTAKQELTPKPKPAPKPKGPVDVEKQCGVALPSGGLCARSLTCKTHSMGAKRAVPGRSAPYDVLLQQYHKRNQASIAKNHAMKMQLFTSSKMLPQMQLKYYILMKKLNMCWQVFLRILLFHWKER